MAKQINSKTQECDTVWDGGAKCDVLRRIGDFLVLRAIDDGGIYLRHIEGGSRRYLTVEEATQEAVNRTVWAQAETSRVLQSVRA